MIMLLASILVVVIIIIIIIINYKDMGTLNRSLDGHKPTLICRSTGETKFYCPFMGQKYYETCAMFVILMGHVLAVKNGVSQQFKTEEVSTTNISQSSCYKHFIFLFRNPTPVPDTVRHANTREN